MFNFDVIRGVLNSLINFPAGMTGDLAALIGGRVNHVALTPAEEGMHTHPFTSSKGVLTVGADPKMEAVWDSRGKVIGGRTCSGYAYTLDLAEKSVEVHNPEGSQGFVPQVIAWAKEAKFSLGNKVSYRAEELVRESANREAQVSFERSVKLTKIRKGRRF